ncbi:hypothetical protein K438DRAFT_1754801 [Mycena galopus ATCC 62051]|nr:hypothetical protein K438DRAFT_1754801 [Mycena galopus ATCC 62051]
MAVYIQTMLPNSLIGDYPIVKISAALRNRRQLFECSDELQQALSTVGKYALRFLIRLAKSYSTQEQWGCSSQNGTKLSLIESELTHSFRFSHPVHGSLRAAPGFTSNEPKFQYLADMASCVDALERNSFLAKPRARRGHPNTSRRLRRRRRAHQENCKLLGALWSTRRVLGELGEC